MSEKSPAYLWYPKDVISSGKVSELTASEECWYRRALDQSWLEIGLPADPAKAAKRIGKGCTTRAAAMILETFFYTDKKDANKKLNKKQEVLRKELRKKSAKRAEAGRLSGEKRREQRDLKAEQMLNKRSNKTRTKTNIPIPSSFPFPKSDFKRLILHARGNFPNEDPRLVEIGVLYTMLQRNGSSEPIKSAKYFTPEIVKACKDAKGMASKTIDALLARRREQLWEMQGQEEKLAQCR